MAIYHCSCKVISRSNGHSAVGASAYRSGIKITSEYDGITHNYTPKGNTGQVVHSEVMLCENAPEEYRNREILWNEVERAEKGSNAQLAREYEFALPRELSHAEQIEFTREFVRENFVKDGMCADIAIHDKGDGNPHAHVMVPLRPIDENGKWENKAEKLYLCKNSKGEERAFTSKELLKDENAEWKKQYHYSKNGNPKGKKVYLSEYEISKNPKYKDFERIKGDKYPKTEKFGKQNAKIEKWNSKEFLERVRENLAVAINKELERKELPQRVDHRSYEAQGIEKIPTIHEGKSARKREDKRTNPKYGDRYKERYKEPTELIEINKEIKQSNEKLKEVNKEIEKTWMQIDKIECDIQWTELHERIDSIRKESKSGYLDEAIQKEYLDKLWQAQIEAEQLYDARASYVLYTYSSSENGNVRDSWMDYLQNHHDKAASDIEFINQNIERNMEFISSIPYHEDYSYPNISVKDIKEEFRAEMDNGNKMIIPRTDAERTVIRDIKESDKELCERYDTTMIRRLIAEQERNGGRTLQNRNEILLHQIREGFENLRFIEKYKITSAEEAKMTADAIRQQSAECSSMLNDAEKSLERLQILTHDNPETHQREVQQYRERIYVLKNQLEELNERLEGYERCTRILDRIESEKQNPELKKSFEMETVRADLQKKSAEAQKVSFDADTVSEKLAKFKDEFIRETARSYGRTFYQPNTIYHEKATRIEESIKRIKKYRNERYDLDVAIKKVGILPSKQKKELQNKRTDIMRLERDEEAKLERMLPNTGQLLDLDKTEKYVKELYAKAAQEDAWAKEAQESVGAKDRAAEAKASFHRLAKTVPEKMKESVLANMEKYRLSDNSVQRKMTMEEYNAIKKAEKELDSMLKPADSKGTQRDIFPDRDESRKNNGHER